MADDPPNPQDMQHAIETLQDEWEQMRERDRERSTGSDVPLFYGRSNEDFQTFFEQFELTANGHNWTPEQRCRKLPMRLRETAYDVYRGLAVDIKNDFAQLQQALNEALRPPEVSRLKAAELHRCMQNATEKVNEFAFRLRELARGAYPDMPELQQERLLRDLFIRSLRPDVQMAFYFQSPATFQEAFNIARQFEANRLLLHTNVPALVAPGVNPSTESAVAIRQTQATNFDFQMGTIQKDLKEMKELTQLVANTRISESNYNNNFSRNQGSFSRYRPPFRGSFSFRGQSRNRWNRYPNRGQSYPPRGQFFRYGPSRWSSAGRPICNRCGRNGHVAVSCYQPPNYGQPNNFQGPGTWYFQPTSPMGAPESSDYPSADLPVSHRPLALPPSGTQEQLPNRQHVRSTCIDVVPSTGTDILQKELIQAREALASAQAETRSAQAETDRLKKEQYPEFWVETASSNVLNAWCSHTTSDILEISPRCLLSILCACGRRPENRSGLQCSCSSCNAIFCILCNHEEGYCMNCQIRRTMDNHMLNLRNGCGSSQSSINLSTPSSLPELVSLETLGVSDAPVPLTDIEATTAQFYDIEVPETLPSHFLSAPNLQTSNEELPWENQEYLPHTLSCPLIYVKNSEVNENEYVLSLSLNEDDPMYDVEQWLSSSPEGNSSESEALPREHSPCCNQRTCQWLGGLGIAITSIIIFLTLSFCFHLAIANPNHTQHQFQFCGTSRSGHILAVPTQVRCIPPKTDVNVTETTVKVWVPRSDPVTRLAYKCMIRTRTICTHMSFIGGKGIVGDFANSQAVSVEDCQLALTDFSKTLQQFALTEIHSGIWSTNNTLTVEYVWCCTDHCTTVKNLIIEQGEIATFDGIHLSSSLGDPGGCGIEKGYCKGDEGTIVWQSINTTNFCPYQPMKLLYHATVSDQHVIVHDLQAAFSISHSALEESNNCNLKLGFVTHQGPILVFHDEMQTHKYFDKFRYKNTTEPSRNFRKPILDPENLKFEYLKLWTIAGFHVVWQQLCQLAAQQLTFIHHLIRLDATLGARALLRQDDIFAVHAGEALIIWKCRQVLASTVYWDYKVNQTCYQYLPIQVNGSLFFAVPGSKDLVAEAPSIDCNHHHHGVYLKEGQWHSAQGPIHVSVIPIEVVWQGHWKPFSFDTPVLFHDKLAGIISTFGTFKTYVTKLEQLHGITTRLIDYTASFSTDPRIVRNAIAGIGEGIGDMFVGAGTGLEHVLRGAGQGIGELVNGLLKGPMQLVLNIILCVLVIAVILGFLYLVIRKFCFTRSTNSNVLEAEKSVLKFLRSRKGFWGFLKSKSSHPTMIDEKDALALPTEIVPLTEGYSELPKGTGHNQRPLLTKQVCLGADRKLQKTPKELEVMETSTLVPIFDKSTDDCTQTITSSQIVDNTDNINSPTLADSQQSSTKVQIHHVHETPQPTSTSTTQSYSINWPPKWNNHIRINTGLPTDLARVPLLVGTSQILALLDTGSSISLIPKQMLPKCHLGPIQPTKTICVSLTGHSVQIEGIVKATITINETTIKHSLHVMNNDSEDFILGTDLMARFEHWNLDFSKDKLSVAGIALPLLGNSELGDGAVKLHSDLAIPSNCQVVFPAKVDCSTSQQAIFEPDSVTLDACGLKAPRLFVQPQNGLIPVRLLNFCSYAIQLQKGTCLGQIQSISDPVRVATVEMSPETLPELWQQIDLSTSVLTETEKHELEKLLKEYQAKGLFAASDYDLGCTDRIQHPIDTQEHPPIKLPPYRIAIAEKSKVLELITKMQAQNIIRPSASPWSSPVVIVPKKDGSLRFCCDYRQLNALSKKDVYPLPRIDDLLRSFFKAKYFSSLDMMSGYWQIKLRDNDCEKTAFVTFCGLYEWTRMPFGLTGAPSTFQRLVDLLLCGLVGTSVTVYLDDILIYSSSFDEHLKHLREVFDRLLGANLKLKPSKCTFAHPEVSFLGHVVTRDGIRPDEKKILAIKKFPPPRDVTGVKRILGLLGYYRHFICAFAKIAAPLHHLLKAKTKFEWTPDCQDALDTLKEKLISYPVLVHPDFSKDFILETDACLTGIAAILSQEQDDKTVHPIAYASRALHDAEKNYACWETEILAVQWGIRYFRPYIYGRKTFVFCDQASVRYALTCKNLHGRLARWGLTLQEYDLVLQHRPGKQNANADALSRAYEYSTPQKLQAVMRPSQSKTGTSHPPDKQGKESASNPTNQSSPTNTSDYISTLQRQDPFLAPHILYLEHELLPSEDPQLASAILNHSSRYCLQDGVLFCTANCAQKLLKNRLRGRHTPHLLVVPKSLQAEVLEANHCELGGGHFGIDRTFDKILLRYYWPNLRQSVVDFCQCCLGCFSCKAPTHSYKLPLNPIPIIAHPFDTLAIDVVGPLPMTERGNKYLITAICMFSNWPEIVPMAETTAKTVARFLFDYIICRQGCPRVLLSDLGSNFMSDLIQEVCKLTDTRKVQTVAYRAQSNGRLERYHKTLMTTLSMYVSANQRDWDLYIQLSAFAFRVSRHETTGEMPAYLVLGRDLSLPMDVSLQLPNPVNIIDIDDYKLDLMFRLHSAWKIADECINKAQQKQKYFHDKRVHLPLITSQEMWYSYMYLQYQKDLLLN